MMLPNPPHIIWQAPVPGDSFVWIPGRGGTSWSLLPVVTKMKKGTHLVMDHFNSKSYAQLAESGSGLVEGMAQSAVRTASQYFDRFHLIGISMGGLVAQEIAAIFSHSLMSLHLCCTVTGGGGVRKNFVTDYCLEQWSTKPLPGEDPILKALAPCVGEDCLEKTYFKNFYQHTLLTPIPPTASVLGYQWEALFQYSSRSKLNSIGTPSFCYHGITDRVIEHEEMIFIHEQIPDSKWFEYPSGHLFFLEFTKEFLKDLVSNVEGLNSFEGEGTAG